MLSIARTPSWLRPADSGSGPGGQSEEGMELSSWIGLEAGCQNIEDDISDCIVFLLFYFLKISLILNYVYACIFLFVRIRIGAHGGQRH